MKKTKINRGSLIKQIRRNLRENFDSKNKKSFQIESLSYVYAKMIQEKTNTVRSAVVVKGNVITTYAPNGARHIMKAGKKGYISVLDSLGIEHVRIGYIKDGF